MEDKIKDQRSLPADKETGQMNKKIVCWIGDAPNHRALVSKIADQYGIAAIVIDTKKSIRPSLGLSGYIRKIIDKFRYGKIDNAWSFIQQHYRRMYTALPQVPVLRTDSINSTDVAAFTAKHKADLVIVSGTSIIKEPLVSLPLSIGIMNLHTGLSPYVKGGPNCTNWCIANNEWGLIGNTIMWLSAGIDSGNIITTERIDVSNEKNLPDIHLKVMEHAHALYLKAIGYALNSPSPHQSVIQRSLGKGNLYYTKMWTDKQKKQLLDNLKLARKTDLPDDVKTVPLP